MEQDQNPLFVFFAGQLKRLRTAKGWSQEALGKRLGYSGEMVSKVETRTGRPSRDFAKACDVEFPDMGAMFTALVEQAERSPGVYPAWFASMVDAEQRASVIRWWEPMLVPGLLQTADYARALFEIWQAVDGDRNVDDLVTARIARQAILDRPAPPSFQALIDESALYREVGGPQVMRDQLLHLAEMSERPRVSVQVVPASVGAHVGCGGGFIIASFIGDDTPGIVYLDTVDEGETSKHPGTVARISLTYDTLRSEALPVGASRDLIRRVAEER